MSKVINLEIRFLVQGLFPMEAYAIDDFELQTIETNEDLFDGILKDNPMYTPLHLINATFQEEGEKTSYHLILTNFNYALEVDGDLEELSKEYIDKYVQENLVNLKNRLEKELKLITNLDIALPVAVAKAEYTEEFGNISIGVISRFSSNLKISHYTEHLKLILTRRLSRGISIKSLEDLGMKNSRFKRALEFYFNSFNATKRSVSFTLLFSSLEALFNLTGNRVSHSIASATSKILFFNEEDERDMFNKIKDFYDRRSYYIHGNKPRDITEAHDFELREIVRKVILIYWQISLMENIDDSKKIVDLINDKRLTDLNFLLQSFIKHLEDNDFNDMRSEMLDI